MDFGNYITGFTEGEGCFCISFNRRSKLSTNIEVRPSFSISQNYRNLDLMKKIYNYFKCGSIRFSHKDNNYKFEVRSLKELNNIIIPHFVNYPLYGVKKKDFEKFTKICRMMKSNLHLNKEKIKQIINLAYEINCGSRKYEQSKLLKYLAR